MDSALYLKKIFKRYHKYYLEIPYEYYDTFLSYGIHEDLKRNSGFLKQLIENEMEV
jgi:hypothetical protein